MNLVKNQKEKIVCIEYREDKPCTVITKYQGFNYYDVQWCEKRKALYHTSSIRDNARFVMLDLLRAYSGNRKIWAEEYIMFGREVLDGDRFTQIEIKKDQLRHFGYEIITEPIEFSFIVQEKTCNPFEAGSEDEAFYCCICNDSMLEVELCRHLFWDNHLHAYIGVGNERERTRDFKEHIMLFISKLSKPVVKKLYIALKTNSIKMTCRCESLKNIRIELIGDDLWHYDVLENSDADSFKDDKEEGRFVTGGQWLVSLDAKKTKEDNQLIAGWIESMTLC